MVFSYLIAVADKTNMMLNNKIVDTLVMCF